ncbi:MAG: AEC family transporter, partial [Pseudomonadota bacterium]
MSAFGALITIVLPVFLVVGAGYGMVRLKAFPDQALDGLVKFATGFAVPVLLFRAMFNLDLTVAIRWEHYLSFYGAAFFCFCTGITLARVIWQRRPGEAVAVGFLALFSNSVLLGLPIADRAFGAEVLAKVFALFMIHTPFCYFVGILAMEFSRRDGAPLGQALRRTFEAMFRNALTIGLVTGLLANVAGVRLPGVALEAIDMIAEAALPIALFGIGGVMTRYSLKADPSEALMVSALSILVHPALVWIATTQIFALPQAFVLSAVIIAAMPTGING